MHHNGSEQMEESIEIEQHGDNKGFTYEKLCENIENVLKEISQKTYQNLIWVVILSLMLSLLTWPYQSVTAAESSVIK